MRKITSIFFRSCNFCNQEKALYNSLVWGAKEFKTARALKGFAVLFKWAPKYQESYELLGHDLWFFKERKLKWDSLKKKKKSLKINLFPVCYVLESCVCFSSLILSPAIFGGFLSCNKFDTVLSAALGKSLLYSYGHSQIFSAVLWSLCFSLFSPTVYPIFPPHTEHQKLFVPSAGQRYKLLFSKDNPDTAKTVNLSPVFSQDLCLLTSCSTSFSMQMSGFMPPNQNAHAAKRDFQSHQILCGVKCHLEVLFPSHWL